MHLEIVVDCGRGSIFGSVMANQKGSDLGQLNLVQFVDKCVYDVFELHFHCLTEHTQLHQVQPAFAAFYFADVGLRFADALSELDLGEAGCFAVLADQGAQDLVFAGERGFFHGGSFRLPLRNI